MGDITGYHGKTKHRGELVAYDKKGGVYNLELHAFTAFVDINNIKQLLNQQHDLGLSQYRYAPRCQT